MHFFSIIQNIALYISNYEGVENKEGKMGITFLYWNVHNKGRQLMEMIAQIVDENQIDILALSELTLQKEEIGDIISEVEKASGLYYFNATNKKDNDTWMYLFYRKNQSFALRSVKFEYLLDWRDIVDRVDLPESCYFSKYQERNERMFFVKLEHAGDQSTLLVPIHFPSKGYASPKKQERLAEAFNNYIQFIERELKLSRTIVFGDFNMNPFEPGMVGYKGFHALPDRSLLDSEIKHLNTPYPAYYNPGWSLLGDYSCHKENESISAKRQPSGSYFLRRGTDEDHYWYLFDQVIMRRDMIDEFDLTRYRLIKEVGGLSLLNRNLTPNTTYSDHLPITFTLNDYEKQNRLLA